MIIDLEYQLNPKQIFIFLTPKKSSTPRKKDLLYRAQTY